MYIRWFAGLEKRLRSKVLTSAIYNNVFIYGPSI